MPRHPSQLYEGALEGLVLFGMLRLATHRFGSLSQPGCTIGLFLLGYGFARIIVEFFREPDFHIGYLAGDFLTMGMVLSTPMLFAGILMVWWSLNQAGKTSTLT
jgi:phosphatidylglycerol:prolipoprotein diacylglycerol transferase